MADFFYSCFFMRTRFKTPAVDCADARSTAIYQDNKHKSLDTYPPKFYLTSYEKTMVRQVHA